MEYGSRRLSCWCCCVVVAAVLLLSSPHTLVAAAGAAPRRLLQISEAQQFVVPQTHLRAIYGLRPLKWSSDLAEKATQWADQYKGDCGAAAAAGGVNVFRGYGGEAWQPSDAVAAWAEEAQHYDYGANACAAGKECGRYKQMMWRDSTQVGCASVPCASGETLMACHYEPQGNIMGQKPF
ncbi:pathogenesis-related protein PRB1-3-like [Oryza brachyantha]|uniref:pathogenesis-related protein PRB1-3-like n=1 Tax=Oryza brachyantha TaxID=4533 RepID=UPI001AD9F374|nr:pathogenesis-related protein PRB1-3-like [Oryza brachyantha]